MITSYYTARNNMGLGHSSWKSWQSLPAALWVISLEAPNQRTFIIIFAFFMDGTIEILIIWEVMELI